MNRMPIPLPVRVQNSDLNVNQPAIVMGGRIVSSSGLNTVVESPGANLRLRLYRIEAHNNHATTPLTVGIGAGNVAARYLPAAGGFTAWDFGGGVLVLDNATALSVYLSGAGTISVAAYYEVV